MKKLGFCLLLSVTLTLLASACWAGEPMKAEVTGENVNVRAKPNAKAKVLWQAGILDEYIVDSTAILDKASGLKWHRILFHVNQESSIYFNEIKQEAYIAANFLQTKRFDADDKEWHKKQVKRLKENELHIKNATWRVTEFTEESVIYTQDEKIKSVPIYADTSLKSKKIAELPVDTTVLMVASKFRYIKQKDKGYNEGWVKITKPITGWVPVEFIGLAYSDYFGSMGMTVQ